VSLRDESTDKWEFDRDREALSAAPRRVAEVGRLLADGLGLRAIAKQLGISVDEATEARAQGRRFLRLRRKAMEARAAGEEPERSAVLLR